MPDDLVLPGFTGHYVVAPDGVQEGTALRPVDIAAWPAFPIAPPIELLLSLPVPRIAISTEGVNAGGKVQLCGKPPTAFGSVTVRLIRCDRPELGASCSAIVALPSSAVSELAAKGLKDQTATGDLHLAATCG